MLRDLRFSSLLLVAAVFACSGSQTGGGNSSSLSIVPTPTSALADGNSPITLLLTATGTDGNPYNGIVSLNCKEQVVYGDTKVQNDTVTMVKGLAQETITCPPGADCTGKITIDGSLASNGATATAQTQVTFTAIPPNPDAGMDAGPDAGPDAGEDGGMDAGPTTPGEITFGGGTHPYMGVDYGPTGVSQFTQNTFTFQVFDITGHFPIPNVPVTFSANGPGALPAGSYLEPPLTNVLTDSMGQVQLTVHSGQTSGTVTITATVEDGTNLQTIGQGQVVGTQPSVAKSSLSCTPENLPVYLGSQGSYPCETSSDVLQKTVCTANLADRFGNVVTVQVAVKLFSEAGNFELPATQTPAFGGPGTAGAASNTLDTNGSLPEDVSPLPADGSNPGEPFYTDQCAGVPGHTYNPRDGLVTVIAVFQGEEAFVDSAGVYQPGDTFTDLPQPFVDSNDSSAWDPGEPCEGQSQNGTCGGPNGVWDANSNVFIISHVLYTGHGNESTAACNGCPVSPLQGTTISFLPQTPNESSIPLSGSVIGTIDYADINLNVPAAVATTSLVVTGPQSLTLKYPENPGTCTMVDFLGMNITPLDDCDAGSVPDDAGNAVPSTICLATTHITNFHGGFFGCQYQLSNGNNTASDGGPHPYTLTATLDVDANTDSQSYNGGAQ